MLTSSLKGQSIRRKKGSLPRTLTPPTPDHHRSSLRSGRCLGHVGIGAQLVGTRAQVERNTQERAPQCQRQVVPATSPRALAPGHVIAPRVRQRAAHQAALCPENANRGDLLRCQVPPLGLRPALRAQPLRRAHRDGWFRSPLWPRSCPGCSAWPLVPSNSPDTFRPTPNANAPSSPLLFSADSFCFGNKLPSPTPSWNSCSSSSDTSVSARPIMKFVGSLSRPLKADGRTSSWPVTTNPVARGGLRRARVSPPGTTAFADAAAAERQYVGQTGLMKSYRW